MKTILLASILVMVQPVFGQSASNTQCNLAVGEEVFALCSACHTRSTAEPAREGPSLFGVIGRKAGSVSEYKFSPALSGSGWTWDENTLNQFLKNPRQALPGTTMTFIGLKSETERRAVACYMGTFKNIG